MRKVFLETADDIQRLRETHLKGVTLPTKWAGFQSAVLQGNEDCPDALNLYLDPSPNYYDDYYRVTFNHLAPIYCGGCEMKGTAE